jgi:hypothetical protein
MMSLVRRRVVWALRTGDAENKTAPSVHNAGVDLGSEKSGDWGIFPGASSHKQ